MTVPRIAWWCLWAILFLIAAVVTLVAFAAMWTSAALLEVEDALDRKKKGRARL